MLLTNILLGLLLAAVLFQTWVNHQGLKKRKAAPRRKKKATVQPAPAGPVKRYKAIVPGEHDRKQNYDEPD
jgi:hypothetical protein